MTQNGFIYYISAMEKNSCSKGSKPDNFLFKIIEKVLLRLYFFINTPNYTVPDYNLKERVALARDLFQTHLKNIDKTSVYNTELSKVLLKIELQFSSSQQTLLHELIKQLVNEKSKLFKIG